MKKYIALFLLLLPILLLAQAPPQGFNYQAVARDNAGNILASTPISVRLGIRDNSASGTLLYQEQHNVTTTSLGLFTVVIGQGVQTAGGAFQNINWTTNLKFIEVEANFGSGYVNLGASQLWSVPYSLYSLRSAIADSVAGGSGGGGGVTLDGAYDFGGPGAGRIITADNGPVQINGSGSNTAALGVLFTGIGNCINAVNNNSANQFSVIQVQTNSSVNNNSGIFSSTTGLARAIAGQVEQTATSDVGVRGLNLRTTGGIGVEGVGFNGVSGQTNYRNGFGVFGQNFDLVGPTTSDAVGVGGVGYVGVEGQSIDAINGAGIASLDNIIALGGLFVTGTKSFRIDHPLRPAEQYLVHFSLESDEVLNMYRGTVVCDASGEAEIILPDYVEAVNRKYSYHLTPVGAFAGLYVKEKMQNGKFRIAGGNPGMEVCWQLIAERNDPYLQAYPDMRRVEVDKPLEYQGRYLRPELYGQPADLGIFTPLLKGVTR